MPTTIPLEPVYGGSCRHCQRGYFVVASDLEKVIECPNCRNGITLRGELAPPGTVPTIDADNLGDSWGIPPRFSIGDIVLAVMSGAFLFAAAAGLPQALTTTPAGTWVLAMLLCWLIIAVNQGRREIIKRLEA